MAGATGSVAVMEQGVTEATEAATAAGEVATDSSQARLALKYVDALRLVKNRCHQNDDGLLCVRQIIPWHSPVTLL